MKQDELGKMQQKEREKLEELSGLSAEEAKNRLVEAMKDEARTDAAAYVNEIMDEAKLNANAQAKKIVIQTIQRVATETAIENSVSVFHIDNDDVKRLSLSVVLTPFVVRYVVWLSISWLAMAVSTPLVLKRLWQRLRNSLTTRLLRLVSVQLSTWVSTACILNWYVSSVR